MRVGACVDTHTHTHTHTHTLAGYQMPPRAETEHLSAAEASFSLTAFYWMKPYQAFHCNHPNLVRGPLNRANIRLLVISMMRVTCVLGESLSL